MDQFHLDPGSHQGPRILPQNLLDECRERAELFLRIAREAVGRLHAQISSAGYCVLLTDAQGHTIDYQVDSSLRNDCRKAGLYLGTCWSEGEEGTCGVAAVLTHRMPVTVHKRDHFRAAFIGLTCSAAPVFDPQGQLLGVLDVSAVQSPDDRRSQQLIQQMVAQSARAIENAFFMHTAQGHWLLRGHSAPGYVDSQPEVLLAWDSDGCLQAMNSQARRLLEQPGGSLPSHIAEVFDLRALQATRDERAQALAWGASGARLHVRVSPPRRTAVAMVKAESDTLDRRIAEHLRLAVRVKDCNLPVLVQGETGAGKEVFARQLHGLSARRHGPFIALNCAAIPESLIESELFGYAPGAFTGASSKGLRGLLVQADGGTLFLDEIGDMPLGLQTRLLRVLAEGEVAPLGAARGQSVDIQVVCATHRDIVAMVAAGSFREDLYFRLGGACFELPPLRERTDRLALIDRLLQEEGRHCDVQASLTQAALEHLSGYAWPGNLRQLRHALRYACAVCDAGLIRVDDLPITVRGCPSVADSGEQVDPSRQVLLEALMRHQWKPGEAAKALGISRATLYRRVREQGIGMPRQTR